MPLFWLSLLGLSILAAWRARGEIFAPVLPEISPLDRNITPTEAFRYGTDRPMTKRGTVVPLTPAQVVQRALYLAGEVDAPQLDPFVKDPAPACATIFYRLEFPNGGEDPTAKDPASRWQNDAKTFTFITCDCVGGAAWCSGFDRKQSVRFAHLYSGSINTNSMILDAEGPRKCFVPFDRPAPGMMIVCKSGTPGHAVGHIGVIVSVPAEWDPRRRESWAQLGVVDVASRKDANGKPSRANKRTTGIGWYGTGALFVRSIMKP